jgi:Zn-dependent protease
VRKESRVENSQSQVPQSGGENSLDRPPSLAPHLQDWDYSPPPYRRHVVLPVLLFLATCMSTFWTGAVHWDPIAYLESFQAAGRVFLQSWDHQSLPTALADAAAVLTHAWNVRQGLLYMAAVVAILLSHEMGHFLLACRHRVRASLPFFIPVPILPFGTLGAVIGLEGSRANRRQMFDLGLAGPLAGLAIALPVIWLGIRQLPSAPASGSELCFHNPLIFRLLIEALRPDYPTPDYFYLNQFNPLLMAGWVGVLVTGLNMLPVSQLDGGHVAYALLGRRAHVLARGLVVAVIVLIVISEKYAWVVMLVVVVLLGTDHPPTADDRIPLGWPRRVLGWLALGIPIFCFPSLGITPRS